MILFVDGKNKLQKMIIYYLGKQLFQQDQFLKHFKKIELKVRDKKIILGKILITRVNQLMKI